MAFKLTQRMLNPILQLSKKQVPVNCKNFKAIVERLRKKFADPFIDGLVKSQRSDDKVKRFRCKARKYEGMRRTYWYIAMTEDAAQRSRWTFYDVVVLNSQTILFLYL